MDQVVFDGDQRNDAFQCNFVEQNLVKEDCSLDDDETAETV